MKRESTGTEDSGTGPVSEPQSHPLPGSSWAGHSVLAQSWGRGALESIHGPPVPEEFHLTVRGPEGPRGCTTIMRSHGSGCSVTWSQGRSSWTEFLLRDKAWWSPGSPSPVSSSESLRSGAAGAELRSWWQGCTCARAGSKGGGQEQWCVRLKSQAHQDSQENSPAPRPQELLKVLLERP